MLQQQSRNATNDSTNMVNPYTENPYVSSPLNPANLDIEIQNYEQPEMASPELRKGRDMWITNDSPKYLKYSNLYKIISP